MKSYVLLRIICSVLIFLCLTIANAQNLNFKRWDFEYKGIKIQSHPAKKYLKENVLVGLGEPFIIAAKDDSPGEGTFVGPYIYNVEGILYVHWSSDWDVLDPKLPNNGRISYDGGKTWEKNVNDKNWGLTPLPSTKYQTGENEITAYAYKGFEIPDNPEYYKVPTWRSYDNGQNWGKTEWTKVIYPGIKGLDIYNPPEIFKKKDRNYLRGGTKPDPPEYLSPFYNKVSRNTGPGIRPLASDSDGTIYSMIYSRMFWHNNIIKIKDWEKDYWEKLNWNRYAIYLQISEDRGKTWKYKGIVANGADYEGKIDFAPGDGFSEPSLVIYPDGEMVCVMRTGSHKPLYITKSRDKGKSWSKPQCLPGNENEPIRGVRPKLVLLENHVLVLATGRPDITVHFSKDRGNTWFKSDTLYYSHSLGIGLTDTIYQRSHHNVHMAPNGQNSVLVVHDATRYDETAENEWLKRAGHGLIIGRIIKVEIIKQF